MTEPDVEAADTILRRHKVGYVVIGGQAVGQAIRTTTDVDVMVAAGDYRRTIRALREDPALRFDWEENGVTRFLMASSGGEPLDVLDSRKFSGGRSGSEFFEFLVDEGSVQRQGIRYAKPSVVWFTRLMVPRWKDYAEKIVLDLLGGAAGGQIRRVREIARRFGTYDQIKERIDWLEAEMKRPDLEYALRDE